MTLREQIQEKITAAENELAAMRNELSALEVNAADILAKDVEAVKSWFATAAKYLGF